MVYLDLDILKKLYKKIKDFISNKEAAMYQKSAWIFL